MIGLNDTSKSTSSCLIEMFDRIFVNHTPDNKCFELFCNELCFMVCKNKDFQEKRVSSLFSYEIAVVCTRKLPSVHY